MNQKTFCATCPVCFSEWDFNSQRERAKSTQKWAARVRETGGRRTFNVWDVRYPDQILPVLASSRYQARQFFFKVAPFGFASAMHTIKAALMRSA